jgi:hypothetical protein
MKRKITRNFWNLVAFFGDLSRNAYMKCFQITPDFLFPPGIQPVTPVSPGLLQVKSLYVTKKSSRII